mgnify:FL=1|tara:strand:+ start:362 stop:610 length:249 start_codon:yes stop_codon:yes gene_type:complete
MTFKEELAEIHARNLPNSFIREHNKEYWAMIDESLEAFNKIVPAKKEADVTIAHTETGAIKVNSQITRGFNQCVDQMKEKMK